MAGATGIYANMSVGRTAMPRIIPAKASLEIFEGDFNGLDFLEKREADRLINAVNFEDSSQLTEIFRRCGLYRVPQLTVPYISLPDGSIHQAKSQVYFSFKPQADGSTEWKVIAQPMVSQVKPFYFSEGCFDKELSDRFKQGIYSLDHPEAATQVEEDHLEIIALGPNDDVTRVMDKLQEELLAAARWGAITFERFLAGQIKLPERMEPRLSPSFSQYNK